MAPRFAPSMITSAQYQISSMLVIMTTSRHYQGEREHAAGTAHNERYEMREHADHSENLPFAALNSSFARR